MISEVGAALRKAHADAEQVHGNGRRTDEGKADALEKIAANAYARIDGKLSRAIARQAGLADVERQNRGALVQEAAGPNPAESAAPFVRALEQHEGWTDIHLAELTPHETAALAVSVGMRRTVAADGSVRRQLSDEQLVRLRAAATPGFEPRRARMKSGLEDVLRAATAELGRAVGQQHLPPASAQWLGREEPPAAG